MVRRALAGDLRAEHPPHNRTVNGEFLVRSFGLCQMNEAGRAAEPVVALAGEMRRSAGRQAPAFIHRRHPHLRAAQRGGACNSSRTRPTRSWPRSAWEIRDDPESLRLFAQADAAVDGVTVRLSRVSSPPPVRHRAGCSSSSMPATRVAP